MQLNETALTPLRQQLMQVSQLTDIRSEAREGSGTIQLSFEQGADIDYIFIEVNEKIDRCTSSLPREIERPKVIKASATDIPAFYIDMTLRKEPQTDGLDELHPVSDQFIELSRFASQVITKRIEQLSEVAMVDVSGGVSSELLVIPDEERLRQAGITIGDVENALRSMDISLGSLTIRDGEYQYNVKFRTVAGGKSDVEEMSRLQASFPPQITASLSYDASRYISDELDKIYSRTLWCLAILLVFVFLVSRDVRYLVMITVTLAVNLLVAVVFYNLLDVGIHIYSLAGITVSLGIMIDTAIIMVDHYSYYHNRRVFTSILGALLTTIGALGIVWLLPEDQQANLTDFSLVIIINLTVSMIVALLFVPSMIDKFPLGRSMTTLPRRSRRRIARISRRYECFIAWGRRHRWAFLVLLVWGFGIPTFLLPERLSDPQDENPPLHRRLYDKVMTSRFVTENRLTLDMIFGTSVNLFNKKTSAYSYYRSPEQKRLIINAGMPEGCTVQQLNDVVRHMENYISQYDEIASFNTSVNSYDNATMEVTFRREYENTSFPSRLKQEIISAAANFGGATWRVSGVDDQYFNNNVVTSYRSNSIRLRGYNYDQLSEFADRLLDSLGQNRRVSEPEIMDGNSWSLPSNEFHIRYNDEQIAAAGLNIYDYYSALSTKLYNRSLATIYNGHELQRVVMESGGRDRFDKWNLENALVTETDTPMKLSTVGSIEKRRTGMAIRRSRQSYEISVGFDFIGSYELCNRLVDKTIKQFNEEILPLGFRADAPSYGGWNDSKKTQIKLILLVIAIIYTMCAIIFESLLKPLVIIMMIPISFIGVFLTFGLFDFRFDQGGFAAFVLLCGIVVNAGIYLITEYDECRRISSKQGLQLYLMAFNHKIVPISLTILSTILGLVPFLYDGPEEVFWFAFAMAAISGTAFSILALIIYLPIFMPLGERKSTESVHDYGTRNVCSDVGPNRSA